MSSYYFKNNFKNPSLIMIFLVLLMFIMLLKWKAQVTQTFVSTTSSSSNKDFDLMRSKFRHCVRAAAEPYYYNTFRFFEELNVCMNLYYPINFYVFDTYPNGANGERKVFLPMAPEFYEEECKWLTIGIGGLAGAEELAHAKYPNCQIYGVEPAKYGNFTKTGKLIKVGVGLVDENLDPVDETKMKVYTFPRLLEEFVHSRLVHYLSIDIESYEMIVMRELVGNGKWADEEITFCQIDIELHNPNQGNQNPLAKDINRVQWMLDFIDESSPYMPIFTVSYNPPQKVTFVNVVNAECERAFKISTYFNKK